MIKKAVRDHLLLNSTVTAGLATFRFADGAPASAAIFTGRQIPAEDAEFPLIFIDGQSGTSWGARGKKGVEVTLDVSVFDEKTESDQSLETLAWEIQNHMDRANLSQHLAGWTCVTCIAGAPRAVGGAGYGFPGYTVTVRMKLLRI